VLHVMAHRRVTCEFPGPSFYYLIQKKDQSGDSAWSKELAAVPSIATAMLVAAWPLLQLALMPSQASTSVLHARAPRGPVAPGRLGILPILMVEKEQSANTGVLHQPFVDEKNPSSEKKIDRSNYKMLSGSGYAEESRQYRRTVYMHDEWVKHRSSGRFIRNMRTLSESGVGRALGAELAFITATAIFCVGINMLIHGYQDFSGVAHPSPLADFAFIRDIRRKTPCYSLGSGN